MRPTTMPPKTIPKGGRKDPKSFAAVLSHTRGARAGPRVAGKIPHATTAGGWHSDSSIAKRDIQDLFPLSIEGTRIEVGPKAKQTPETRAPHDTAVSQESERSAGGLLSLQGRLLCTVDNSGKQFASVGSG